MLAIRRNDFAVSIEMMPLIDVVFLLLTFFIFGMLVTAQLEVLSVKLAPLGTARQLEPSQVKALTINIDRHGKLFLGRELVMAEGLLVKLAAAQTGGEQPILFVAMSKAAQVDWTPVALDLIRRFVKAGFTKYTFVGPPVSHESL